MRINTNISAMNAHRQLGANQTNQQKSLERLSSGLRINRAGDDAAGLAISEKMRGQIRGLNQATRNAQDGISLIQTAEGALNESHSILQRMRELAVQSATDTNTPEDRAELQKEVDQLAGELSRIADNTEFNMQTLLEGDFTSKFHIGANAGQSMEIAINDMRADALGVAGSEAASFEQTVDVTDTGTATITFSDGTYDIISVDDYEGTALTETDAHYGSGDAADVTHLMVDGDGNAVGVSEDGLSFYAYDGSTNFDDGGGNEGETFTLDGSATSVTIDATADTATAEVEIADHGLDAGTYTIADLSNHATLSTYGFGLEDANGNIVAVANNTTFANITEWQDVDDTSNVLLSHTADSISQDAEISVTGEGIDISSQVAANDAIGTLDDAIEAVSAERSMLGANQNRLEHTIANLGTSSENLSAAESRIRDVDMAEEMMEFTKTDILNQAATAMLAQANMAPQTVLQLLG